MSNGEITMSKISQRRLQKDIIDIIKNPLSDHGIYYTHDENNMLRGFAVIFGPDDTIYRYGAYHFKFSFPTDYPFSPPKLTFLTNDGSTRFHPNLYRNGKVCISILNTWKGEQWTSCQSIRSILLMLVTLFHNKPLLNEPGIKESHSSFIPYNRIIKYKNIEIAIFKILSKNTHTLNDSSECFYPIYKKYVIENKKNILEYVKSIKNLPYYKSKEPPNAYAGIYNMNCDLDYKKLYKNLKKLFKEFDKTKIKKYKTRKRTNNFIFKKTQNIKQEQ